MSILTGIRKLTKQLAGLPNFGLMAFEELWEESMKRNSWLLQQRPVS
jgi:hypothetical protein